MDDIAQKPDRQRVYNVGSGQLNAEERLELVKILARAGYAARVGRERPDGKPLPTTSQCIAFLARISRTGSHERIEEMLCHYGVQGVIELDDLNIIEYSLCIAEAEGYGTEALYGDV